MAEWSTNWGFIFVVLGLNSVNGNMWDTLRAYWEVWWVVVGGRLDQCLINRWCHYTITFGH